MSKLVAARLLMIVTILVILFFQGYWLQKVYLEEKVNLQKSSDLLFRECMYKLQADRFKNDTLIYRGVPDDNLFIMDVVSDLEKKIPKGDNTKVDGPKTTMTLSIRKDTTFFNEAISPDSIAEWTHDERAILKSDAPRHRIVKYLQTNTSVDDSIPVKRIDSAYRFALNKAGVKIPFRVLMDTVLFNVNKNPREMQTSPVPIGLMRNPVYHAVLYDTGSYLARRMLSPVLLSALLIALTLVSFIFIFRNLLRQKRLTESKNEFISNITHELKTPISTVGVAIEAMRNFNVLQNPAKTSEYLDIADQELKRLGLLVDKVLKLSMFENRELELSRELVKMDEVIDEVVKSMRLQFEKQNAKVEFTKAGDEFTILGDHLHLASVVYNLLDNALKYSGSQIQILISLTAEPGMLRLEVTDNGIGIPAAYKDKVFEKFFRVPAGDRHNVKGYGLGLSYVAHIVEKHGGKISVDSDLGKFTRFTIEIPRQDAKG